MGEVPAGSESTLSAAGRRPDPSRVGRWNSVGTPSGAAGSLARRASASERPNTGRSETGLYLRLCRTADLIAAPVLLLGIFLISNFPTIAGEQFLAMRVTVRNLAYVIGFAVAWRLLFHAWGLYEWERVHTPGRERLRIIGACTTGSVLALVFPIISVTGAFSVTTVLGFWVGSMVTIPLVRSALRHLVLWRDREPHDVLIVGTGPRALSLYQALHGRAQPPSRVVGFVDVGVWEPERLPHGLFLGSLENFESILMHSSVDEVLIALPIKSRYEEVQRTLQICERVGVRAKYLADLFQHAQAQTRFEGLATGPVVAMLMTTDDYRLLIKRATDVLGAVVGLVALAPVMLAAAMAIKLTSPGPVLFVQPRYGFNRRRFNMFKFRTMVDGAQSLQASLEHLNEVSGPAFKIRNDPRLTSVGRWLRRTSIDELPQFLNVLRGEMSLVGPRPLPERDVGRFTDACLMRRFSVRPGLTCLWQIRGRSEEADFDRWVALDLQYIDRWSLAMDALILMQTIPVVLRGRGAV